ncbi:type II secretion system protein N [Limnobacter sp.]|uniref:type II secretion system protein N n=1 Tax=Limnobacter sp. TaxID=2003368 RepID=UPI003514CF37
MKKWAPWLSLLGVALLALLLNYPVYALADRLAQATGGKVQVLNSQGTVWAGQMQVGVSDGARVYAIGEPLKWNFFVNQQSLWFGVRLAHPKLLGPLHLGLGSGGITVGEGEMRLPASWLGGLGAPFNTIRPEGLLQVRWQGWQNGQDVNLRIQWQDAQSALASIRPLGEYVITVTGNPDTKVNLDLRTNKGALQLEGQGHWSSGQRFVFSGYASSDERSREALTGLLSQMGRREGDKYRLGVF